MILLFLIQDLPDSAFEERIAWKAPDSLGRFTFEAIVPSPDGSVFAVVVKTDSRSELYLGAERVAQGGAIEEVTFGPGRTLCYVLREGGKEFAVRGDKRIGPFDSIARGDPLRIFRARSGGKEVLVQDGVSGPGFEVILWEPAWGGAYLGRGVSQWTLMVGEEKAADFLSQPQIPGEFWVSDGVAVYRVKNSVVRGGRREEYDAVEPIVAGDRRMAHAARKGKSSFVVADGKKQAEYESVWNLRFARDVLAYCARKSGRCHVVVDGAPGEGFASVGEFAFAPDGKTVAYAASTGKSNVFVLGKSRSPLPPGEVGAVVTDGKRWACAVTEGRKTQVICDGKPGRTYDSVSTALALGPGGAVFGATHEGKHLLVEGEKETEIDTPLQETTDAGVRVFRARKGATTTHFVHGFRVDGAEGVEVLASGPRVAYRIRNGKTQRLGIDGTIGEAFDEIPGAPRYAGEVPVYLASSGGRRFLVAGSRKVETQAPRFWISRDGRRVGYCVVTSREIRWRVLALP